MKWKLALRREEFIPSSASVLCSTHFKEDQIDRTGRRAGQTVRLRDGAIPCVFDFPPHLMPFTWTDLRNMAAAQADGSAIRSCAVRHLVFFIYL